MQRKVVVTIINVINGVFGLGLNVSCTLLHSFHPLAFIKVIDVSFALFYDI